MGGGVSKLLEGLEVKTRQSFYAWGQPIKVEALNNIAIPQTEPYDCSL